MILGEPTRRERLGWPVEAGAHSRVITDGSEKCTKDDSRSRRPYRTGMSSSPVLSLHRYFVVASRMQHHFDSNTVPFEDTQSATKEDPNSAVLELFAGPRGNFMYYWYGSLYVVVEGFQDLHLSDPSIEGLIQSPKANALRRCRNGVFHFRPSYLSARSLKLIGAPDFVGWVRELMTAFRGYFDRELKLAG
jgi:hypothetical protein